MYVETMRNVAQGTSRRGAWAGYLDIEHGDFDELWNAVNDDPDDSNIGWIIKDSFIEKLNAGDAEATRQVSESIKIENGARERVLLLCRQDQCKTTCCICK